MRTETHSNDSSVRVYRVAAVAGGTLAFVAAARPAQGWYPFEHAADSGLRAVGCARPLDLGPCNDGASPDASVVPLVALVLALVALVAVAVLRRRAKGASVRRNLIASSLAIVFVTVVIVSRSGTHALDLVCVAGDAPVGMKHQCHTGDSYGGDPWPWLIAAIALALGSFALWRRGGAVDHKR